MQCLTSLDQFRSQEPILAAVGELQFEVVQERMRSEYGVETTLDPLPFTVARWVLGGWPVRGDVVTGLAEVQGARQRTTFLTVSPAAAQAVEKVGRIFNAVTVKDMCTSHRIPAPRQSPLDRQHQVPFAALPGARCVVTSTTHLSPPVLPS